MLEGPKLHGPAPGWWPQTPPAAAPRPRAPSAAARRQPPGGPGAPPRLQAVLSLVGAPAGPPPRAPRAATTPACDASAHGPTAECASLSTRCAGGGSDRRACNESSRSPASPVKLVAVFWRCASECGASSRSFKRQTSACAVSYCRSRRSDEHTDSLMVYLRGCEMGSVPARDSSARRQHPRSETVPAAHAQARRPLAPSARPPREPPPSATAARLPAAAARGAPLHGCSNPRLAFPRPQLAVPAPSAASLCRCSPRTATAPSNGHTTAAFVLFLVSSRVATG